MDVKIVKIDSNRIPNNKNSQVKAVNYQSSTLGLKDISFTGAPIKDPKDLSPIKAFLTKVRFFMSIRRMVRGNEKMMREVSQKYVHDAGIVGTNELLTFEDTRFGGYFNPIDSGIIANKKLVSHSAFARVLPEYFDYEKLHKGNFITACHESQHKIQAVQVYRLAGNQDNFCRLLVGYVNDQKQIIERLKKRTIDDDKISELREKIKLSQDKKEKQKFKEEIAQLKTRKQVLMKQIKSEERKIAEFDIVKVRAYYDEILKQNGTIPKGSPEEAEAKKYMEAFANYPRMMSALQSVSDFESKEAHTAYCEKTMAAYKANYLEVNAQQASRKYTEEHPELVKKYLDEIK